MKKFILKYKVPILVGLLVILFISLSVIIGDIKVKVSDNIEDWIKDTKKDEYVVTVWGSSTCHNCANHKPVMEKLQKEYGFKLYWFELDVLNKQKPDDYRALVNEYNIEDYAGSVPFTFVMKNGEYLGNLLGAQGEERVIEFLKEKNVIE